MLNQFAVIAVLDSSLCREADTTKVWVEFSWTIFDWFTGPLRSLVPILLPILLALGLLVGVRLHRRRQLRQQFGKRLGLLAIALGLGYLLIASPLGLGVASRGLSTFIPADSGKSADAIVVLGRGGDLRYHRVETAAELWREQRAPLIFISGRGDAEPIAEQLQARGIPQQAIEGESCSRTTEENAHFTAGLLEPRGIQRILLVTDPPHMLRSLLTFRSLGFEVIPHPNPMPLMGRRTRGMLLAREYAGLVSYGLAGRFFPRDVPSDLFEHQGFRHVQEGSLKDG